MNSSFDFVAVILLDIWDTSRASVDGVGLRLVECTPWWVCVMWPLMVSTVVGQ